MQEIAIESEPLSEKELLAVQLIAADEITDAEIAERVGVNPATLWRWKKRDDFRDALKAYITECEESFVNVGIGQKNRRLAMLGDQFLRMRTVMLERAADPKMADIPGGKTGLLCRTVKGVGRGDDFELIDLYEVDTALLKEMRETMKQAAQESGQWVEKTALTDPSGKREYSPRNLKPEELDSELEELERAEAAAKARMAKALGSGKPS
jgi:hypothetical protein